MKIFIRALLAGMVFLAGQGVVYADSGYSFSFTVQQKHGAGTKKEDEFETVKNQKWYYAVTMENKSFKDVSNIEIKYVVFTKQVATGDAIAEGGMARHAGTTTIKQILNNDSATFNTDGIMLTSMSYNYGDYVDEGVKGALKGLWIRVYVDGQMVAEFMNPQDLSSKQHFDAPAGSQTSKPSKKKPADGTDN